MDPGLGRIVGDRMYQRKGVMILREQMVRALQCEYIVPHICLRKLFLEIIHKLRPGLTSLYCSFLPFFLKLVSCHSKYSSFALNIQNLHCIYEFIIGISADFVSILTVEDIIPDAANYSLWTVVIELELCLVHHLI